MPKNLYIRCLACLALGLLWAHSVPANHLFAGDQAEEATAHQILQTAGVAGGLVVHVGCADGALTAALCADDRYLVLGLDADAENVTRARARIRSLGMDGTQVSIDRFDGRRLPVIDNAVNLLVAEDPAPVPAAEVQRVLCPGGVACFRQHGRWTKTVKPRPEEIDDWTHFLHGPDGNAVAKDELVGFPYHLQWTGLPQHSRDHEFTTSMDVLVSAGGRLFYIIDEGPTAIPHYQPSRWYLEARDAFSGVVLWKRPLPVWRPFLVSGRKSLAADLWRRLVATDQAVYVTENIFGPVIAVDPKTGKTLRTYAGTEKTEEIVIDGGVLYLVATTLAPEEIDRRQLAVRRITPDRKRILAVAADTGKILWSKEDEDTDGVHPLTLAVNGNRLYFQNTRAVVCLDASSGTELWRYARPSGYARIGNETPTLVACRDVVLSADRASRRAAAAPGAGRATTGSYELIALAAADGKQLWRCRCAENVGAGADVFVANNLVWVGENPRRAASDYNHGRDLQTGEIKKTFSHAENWPTWHHHRCYRDKATENYILAGRTGIEFVDLQSGELTTHHWTRGICEYGILPANGLIYSPPDQCACYIESKLHGFYALAPKRRTKDQGRSSKDEPRLEKGPAYGAIATASSSSERHAPDDWPTFRHDNRRSNFLRGELATDLQVAWTARLGGRLTSPVAAGGRVYVASPAEHSVLALDADSGRTLWRFQAGGPIDSPPSVSDGLAVFGCRDGWVYALRAADGTLAWRFRAAPQDRRLVEAGHVASVWPVHGSVLIDQGKVYCAAGRSSHLDGGMYLYALDLGTGKTVIERHYDSRDPKTGEHRHLFTPYDAELLPDREYPGLLPDVLSSDGTHLFMRAVPLDRELAIQDKTYVRHLFGSMGFLEDSWWERTYWIYGVHFYSGARGHGYAKTLFPAGRILAFDDDSVYGYQDLALNEKQAGIFRVPQNPEFVDLAAALQSSIKRSDRKKGNKTGKKSARRVQIDPEAVRRTFVWKDGIPQNASAMQLTKSKQSVGDTLRKIQKYEFTWHQDVPLYPQAMLLTDRTFLVAGPPRFDEAQTTEYLRTARVDRFQLPELLQDALDTFAGKKGGVLYVVAKHSGERIRELRLPSAPVFDGMIAAGGKLLLAMKDGSVVCLANAVN